MHDNHYPAPYGAQRPRRPSWRLWLALAVVAGVVAGAVVLADAIRGAVDPVARARQEAAFYADQERAARLQWVDDLAYSGLRLVPLLLLVGAGVVAWRRYGWRESIGAHYTVEATRAQRQLFPAGLKSLNYHYSPKGGERQEAPALLPAAADDDDVEPPTFGELLDTGRIGHGSALCLGYDVGKRESIWGTWRDLYSAGLGGVQGSGKTWTAASIAAQSALAGAGLIVCDPNAGDEESLANRLQPLAGAYLVELAESPRSIVQALRYAQEELQSRRTSKADRRPWIVIVDEWTSLLRFPELRETLPAIVADFSQMGRKFGVNALLLAQRWAADDAGGGAVRNTLTAQYIHRMRPDEARYMTGLTARSLPGDLLQLPPGVAYLLDTSGGLRRVATPRMSAADLARCGRLLTADAPTIDAATLSTGRSGARSGSVVAAEVGTTQPLPRHQNAPDARAARVRELLRAETPQNTILRELWGVEGGGAAYTRAAAELRAIISGLVGGAE